MRGAMRPGRDGGGGQEGLPASDVDAANERLGGEEADDGHAPTNSQADDPGDVPAIPGGLGLRPVADDDDVRVTSVHFSRCSR